MIIHIVMFKFKEENKKININEVQRRLNSLVNLIPNLKSMEVGVNFTHSQRAYDLSLYSTFESKEALDEYVIDPEHLRVVEFIKSVTLESKVVDYEQKGR